MIKLTRQVEDKIEYWEVWEHKSKLYIHQGYVGETGTTYKKGVLFKNANNLMDKLAKEMLDQGFDYLDEANLLQFVIHYNGTDNDLIKALKKRHSIENIMNECLGWTGNGDCDGGDIDLQDGSINIFCYVIDVDKANATTIIELKKYKILDNAVIAYLDANEDYITLYPEGAVFSL